MALACEMEIVDLHRFFVAWMSGSLVRTAAEFSRFADVLDEDFVIVSPRGIITERLALIDGLEKAHGGRAGGDEVFRIWIEKARMRPLADDLCLTVYEEWQHVGETTTGRLSSALFGLRPGTPNGVAWLHVHETWLPSDTVG